MVKPRVCERCTFIAFAPHIFPCLSEQVTQHCKPHFKPFSQILQKLIISITHSEVKVRPGSELPAPRQPPLITQSSFFPFLLLSRNDLPLLPDTINEPCNLWPGQMELLQGSPLTSRETAAKLKTMQPSFWEFVSWNSNSCFFCERMEKMCPKKYRVPQKVLS